MSDIEHASSYIEAAIAHIEVAKALIEDATVIFIGLHVLMKKSKISSNIFFNELLCTMESCEHSIENVFARDQ